jgi:hypothetical protein
MECRAAFPARVALLNALDQQIHILMTKTFSCFTAEERSKFKNRQQRIRDLEQELAFTQAEQLYDRDVFVGIYK